MTRLLLILAPCLAALAQSPAPIKIAAPCTEDDMQSLGMSCSADEPCKIYLELSTLESVANRILVAGNLHTSDITLSTVLLVSEDGGKTWNEPSPRIKSASLDTMQFTDLQHGWINGQHVQSFPKDPFFLITRDGGKSWRNIPVYNESRAGAVEKYFFENKDNGTMLLDRIQTGDAGRWGLYETRTGGDSWELKQVTQRKPEFKKSAAHDPQWRLTAIGKTKIYHVEHRAGTKWDLVAAFNIEAGECKVTERAPSIPPTEENAGTEKIPEAGDKPKAPEAGDVFKIGPRTPPKKKQ